MKDLFGKNKSGSVIGSLLFALLGLMLIINPGISFDILCIGVGAVFIISAVANIVTNLKMPGAWSGFLFGDILIGMVGVYFVSAPGLIKGFIPIVLGIIMLFHAVTDIRAALILRDMNENYKWSLLVGAVTLAVAVLVLVNPFETGNFIIRLAGVAFLYDGISGLWVMLSFIHKKKEHDKATTVDYREL